METILEELGLAPTDLDLTPEEEEELRRLRDFCELTWQDIKAIATAVITRAVMDARSANPYARSHAIAFLCGLGEFAPSLDVWCNILGLDVEWVKEVGRRLAEREGIPPAHAIHMVEQRNYAVPVNSPWEMEGR